jgi:hypothetical protein
MAEKTTGRGRKTSKPTKQPIPIDAGMGSQPGETMVHKVDTFRSATTSVHAQNTPGVQAYSGIEEEIRQRAYELYEQRGRQEGFQEEDWARAEAEILSKQRREKSA